MTYKLKVCSLSPDEGMWTSAAWSNFVERCVKPSAVRGGQPSIGSVVDDCLSEFNAVNEHDTDYITFDCEEDASYFVLMFS